jgi:hypothetical protein
VSTVSQIEAAVEGLPAQEKAKLRERLLAGGTATPKTGAELAALWPGCFHLTAPEADEFARDLTSDGQSQVKGSAWE